MGEVETSAGGVTIKTGDKDLGQTALENAPLLGNAVKSFDAADKLTDGVTASEVQGAVSEGMGLIQSAQGAMDIATDPIGWLIENGLNFLISVCEPIQDAIHAVSGDGPALSQAGDNFAKIAEGVEELRNQFGEELRQSVKSWGGDAADTAGSKLADFAKGIDGVAGQAGELSELLHMSSMVMTVIEDFIKAILTELITWLIAIWVPALAAAIPSAGASTAAAGAATTARVATTGSRVARMVAKLRKVLDAISSFLSKLKNVRFRDVSTGFRNAMPQARQMTQRATSEVQDVGGKRIIDKFHSENGMFGSNVQEGFIGSMSKTLGDTAKQQVGLDGLDKATRNTKNMTSAFEGGSTGSDATTEETRDHLDL